MFKIAFRNIFRQRRRSILTILTMLGGFFLSAVSIGWSDGTYNYIIDMFTRNQLGHIQIHARGYLDRPSLYKNIDNYQDVGQKIERLKGVDNWTPRLYSAGLASIGDKSAGVQINGIDPLRENQATRFDKKVTAGRTLSPKACHEVLLGEGLAVILKGKIGDELVIVSQGADGSIANDLYTVTGLISSGNKLTDQSALYLHLDDAQELLVLQGRVHEIAVVADDLDIVDDLTEDIRTELNNPDLTVAGWKEFAKVFYRAMKADQQGAWVMLFVIFLVVAVGVLNTVLMTVLERTREYGVMRAIGTSPGQVFRLVVTEVFIMSVIGILVGAALALTANYLLSLHGITYPRPFTYGGIEFSAMYSEINARSFYIPAVCVIVSALLVSCFPAAKAARIAPARAMRTH